MKLRNINVKTFRTSKNKAPLTGGGFKDATYDYVPEEGENYGVTTGEVLNEKGEIKYLVVIDVDNKEQGPDNWNFIKQIWMKDGDDDTYTVETQGGGLHFYYLTDLPIKLPTTLMRNIDIKYVGGYVVGAGSVGERGEYKVVNDTDVKNLPQLLFRYAKKMIREKKTNKNYELIEYIYSPEDIEKTLTGLMNNRERWDNDGDYHLRLSILMSFKKLGFELSDFYTIMEQSPSDKTKKDWAASWDSYEDDMVGNGDYLNLFNFSGYVPPSYRDKNQEYFKKYQVVKTYSEAAKLASKMFKDRYIKIRIAPKVYVLDMKNEVEITHKEFPLEYSQYKIKILEDQPAKGMERVKDAASIFLENCETLKGYTFDPENPRKIVTIDGDKYYNGYNPIKYQPEYNYDEEYFPRIKDYISNVLASGDEYKERMIHTFVAKTIFKPADRANTFALAATTIQEGTGKSFFGEFMYNIIGGEKGGAAKITNVRELNNENNVLKNKIFVYVDESAQNWNKNDIDMMKDLITGNKFRVKQKYVSGYELPNYTHWYFNSNDVNIAPMGMFDRRYFPIRPSTHRRQDKKYFGALYEEMNNEDAIRHYLGYVYQFKDDIVEMKDTPERLEQIKMNLPPIPSWLTRIAEEESLNWNIYNSRDDYIEVNGKGYVRNINVLYTRFQQFVIEEYPSGRMIKNKKAFIAEVEQYGLILGDRVSLRVDGEPVKYYPIATREELRGKLSKHIKLNIPEDEDELTVI